MYIFEVFPAAKSAADSTIDPLLLVLVSSFGGALVTALAGMIGMVIVSKQEHKRWLRDQRLEAFVSFAGTATSMGILHGQLELYRGNIDLLNPGDAKASHYINELVKLNERVLDMQHGGMENVAAVNVLFPSRMQALLEKHGHLLWGVTTPEKNAAIEELSSEMRRVLKV